MHLKMSKYAGNILTFKTTDSQAWLFLLCHSTVTSTLVSFCIPLVWLHHHSRVHHCGFSPPRFLFPTNSVGFTELSQRSQTGYKPQFLILSDWRHVMLHSWWRIFRTTCCVFNVKQLLVIAWRAKQRYYKAQIIFKHLQKQLMLSFVPAGQSCSLRVINGAFWDIILDTGWYLVIWVTLRFLLWYNLEHGWLPDEINHWYYNCMMLAITYSRVWCALIWLLELEELCSFRWQIHSDAENRLLVLFFWFLWL